MLITMEGKKIIIIPEKGERLSTKHKTSGIIQVFSVMTIGKIKTSIIHSKKK